MCVGLACGDELCADGFTVFVLYAFADGDLAAADAVVDVGDVVDESLFVEGDFREVYEVWSCFEVVCFDEVSCECC